jgi:hypothetical protein
VLSVSVKCFASTPTLKEKNINGFLQQRPEEISLASVLVFMHCCLIHMSVNIFRMFEMDLAHGTQDKTELVYRIIDVDLAKMALLLLVSKLAKFLVGHRTLWIFPLLSHFLLTNDTIVDPPVITQQPLPFTFRKFIISYDKNFQLYGVQFAYNLV